MPLTCDEFLKNLRETNLLSESEIREMLDSVPAEQQPQDGVALATLMVNHNKLTGYQAKTILRGRGRKLILGNYVIEDRIGRGGMGKVYRAHHQNMKRSVALKVVNHKVSQNETLMKRFHREVEAAAKLNHPNIVVAHDADEVDGTWFLVMELVDGKDLSTIVKQRGPLTIRQAVNLILQAARGFQYAHERGVIHRDIKPSNLLLDRSGTLKILDMGLARIEKPSDESALTSMDVVLGTADFMAPEQAASTKNATARSDVYSLGCTLWFLLAGRYVYGGDTLMAKMWAHHDNPIPSLKAMRDDATPQLQAIIEKMLAKDPDDRYQTMADLVTDLEKYKTGDFEPAATQSRDRTEDRNLLDFLGSLEHHEGSPTQASETRFDQPPQLAGHLETVRDPSPTVRSRPRRQKRKSNRPTLAILGGGVALFALIAMFWSDRDKDNPTPDVPGPGHKALTGDHSTNDDRRNRVDPAAIQVSTDILPAFTSSIGPTGGITMEAARSSGVFCFNQSILPDNYQVEIKLLREKGAGTSHFQMKIGDHFFEYFFNYNADNPEMVPANGFLNSANEAEWRRKRNDPESGIISGRLLRDGQSDTIVFDVSANSDSETGEIRLTVNGEEKDRWSGPLDEFLTLEDRFKDDRLWHLIVGQWNGTATIEAATLTVQRLPSQEPPHEALQVRALPSPGTNPPLGAQNPFSVEEAAWLQKSWAEYLSLPVEQTNSLGMQLRLIPPGRFQMGSTREEIDQVINAYPGRENHTGFAAGPEWNPHQVTITTPFYCTATEVTAAQFARFVAATGYTTDAEKAGNKPSETWHPEEQDPDAKLRAVHFVSWNDATEFCRWLSEQEQCEYRLPTEAEWEFVCRAGSTSPLGREFVDLAKHAWVNSNAKEEMPVGLKQANAFGLHDMLGNVTEWCQDYFDRYTTDAIEDPVVLDSPVKPLRRILRGGSWDTPADHARPPKRGWTEAFHAHRGMGFRVVASIEWNRSKSLGFPIGKKISPPAETDSGNHRTIEVVSELGEFKNNFSPWVSADGLRVYWEGIGSDSRPALLTAARRNLTESFQNQRKLGDLLQPKLTADELYVVGVLEGPQAYQLAHGVRSSIDEPFDVSPIAELKNILSPSSPFITDNGKVMVFHVGGWRSSQIAWCQRRTRNDTWQRPTTSLFGEIDFHSTDVRPIWPCMDLGTGLRLWFTRDRKDVIQDEIWTAERTAGLAPFRNPTPVLVNGQPLLGTCPFYRTETNEFYFSRPANGDKDSWEICRISNFLKEK